MALAAVSVPARDLARLLGKMNATACVLPVAPLFCRHLQRSLSQALNDSAQSYETRVTLSTESREELVWWDTHMKKWNGKTLLRREVDLTIDSDASLTGWGAACQDQRTAGPWSSEEKQMHINCRAAGSYTGNSDICQRQIRPHSVIEDRQYHGSSVHQQPWRSSLQGVAGINQEPVDVVPGEEHPHNGTTPPPGS